MNTKTQLLQSIKETEEQLNKLKQELQSYETAPVGTVLSNGYVVVARYEDSFIIAAPSITEVRCKWTPEFSEVFESLKSHGFIPSQWYVPSVDELELAYKNCKEQFSYTFYWASTQFNSTRAYGVNFNNGSSDTYYSKMGYYCVRAFRRVVL